MYITITQAPTDEQIKQFNIKMSQEDAFIDYKVDLSQFDEALRKAFTEAFNINEERLNEKSSVTLTLFAEI
ncbi:hypothetical protein [Sulfurimonas sp. HSL3-7]|uniref:hypothetical protein n=1 Tax=Sulfonitrofixus jiaomeiensis TaxID=3131938 RepID=UPI0031F78F75